jgi:hypothetical protein
MHVHAHVHVHVHVHVLCTCTCTWTPIGGGWLPLPDDNHVQMNVAYIELRTSFWGRRPISLNSATTDKL